MRKPYNQWTFGASELVGSDWESELCIGIIKTEA
ncbi:predicted protein [Chaetomium globosum CBS 148.51]|uniref:Uncharacterized protein n=1 Tax=Chaetomium globosum (strain ATCC 6205 / CBS 148.51 / DSM 1962 / NBRC 6347 / NRRL 1970) TaxID=306901 RepID=Q2GY52_CHAGB|nr:uncharacterized protein CHGG_07102 [Chaetomium globosum CBS 148.51]EAQ85849.1 predicted protein [Chaetomium globosum CBS 148.51]